MAILEGGHIVPPRTQATSRSPAPLGLKETGTAEKLKVFQSPPKNKNMKYEHFFSPSSGIIACIF